MTEVEILLQKRIPDIQIGMRMSDVLQLILNYIVELEKKAGVNNEIQS